LGIKKSLLFAVYVQNQGAKDGAFSVKMGSCFRLYLL